jgi:restriction endonuclease S subunit
MKPTSVPMPQDDWPVRPLASVVEKIFVGLPTSRHAAKDGEPSSAVPVLSVGDMADRNVHPLARIPSVKLRTGDYERFRLQPGDVLVSCRGTLLKTALVPLELRGVLASSNVIAIRPIASVIMPRIIFALLRSAHWQETLRSRTRSSTGLMQLTVKDLDALPVPVPPYELQLKLAYLGDAEELAYRSALDAALRRRDLVDSLVSQALVCHIQRTP